MFEIALALLTAEGEDRPQRIHLSGSSQVNRMKFDMRSYRFFVSQTVRLCLSVDLVPWDH